MYLNCNYNAHCFYFSHNNVFFYVGFEHLYKWFLCGGEVFQIFAYGKKIGAPLDNQDAVILYYPAGGTYVHFPTNGHPQFGNKCLQGRPPSSDKFDKCPENLIKITVK